MRIDNIPPVPCSLVPEASGHEPSKICSWGGPLNVSHVNTGDSGGPLLCGGRQVGICSLSDFVRKRGVYHVLQTHTSVSYFIDWIQYYVPDVLVLN